jgi:hypothetical protein
MARAVFGMHGAGGNGSIQQGFGSNGDQPMGPDFYTIGGYDYGTLVQYRTPTGTIGTISGLPGNSRWDDGAASLPAYISAARAALESLFGIVIDSMIIHGFSYGGGGAQRLCASGYTDGGRVKGYICDDPVDSGNSRPAGNTMPIRFYTCVGGPLPGTPAAAQRWGTTAVANPLGNGAHRPMTFVFGAGPDGLGCPRDETVAGGTTSGVSIPSMWSGGGTVTPPPTVADAFPTYHAENASLLGAVNIAKFFNTATGARGTGYIGAWFTAGEGIRFATVIPTTRAYNIKIRYRQDASAASTTRQLRVDGVNVGSPFAIPPNASGWEANTWTELVIQNVTLTAGARNIDLMYVAGGGPDVDEINIENYTAGGGTGGTPTTTFDVKTNRPGFSSTAYVGGWDAVDEALTWPNVAIAISGAHRLKFRCANKGPSLAPRSVYVDGVKAGNISIPVNASTDIDNAWTEVPFDVTLTAGTHSIMVKVDTGQAGQVADIDRMQVFQLASGGGGTTPPPSGGTGTGPPTTGAETIVQAESGSWTAPATDGAYFATAASNPPALGTFSGTGYAARWYQSPEALNLTLTAAAAGLYTLRFHYRNGNASTASSRTWSVNGTAKTPALSFPKTAGVWTDDAWGDTFAYSVSLLAGANTLVLTCPAGASMGVDLDFVGFTLETGSGGGNTGGGTTPTNVAVTVQAEAASLTAADPTSVPATATYLPGYVGSGFIHNDWHPGDKLDFTVTIPAGGAGDYNLRVRYVNPETFGFSKDLAVNNVSRGTVGPFPPTSGAYSGAWQNFTPTAKIPLVVGTNHVVLTTTGEYGNLLVDEIEVTATVSGGGGGTTTPPPTTGGATVIGGVQLFPADNVFYTDVSGLAVRGDSTARINGTMANNGKFSGYGYTNDVTLDPIMPLEVAPSNQQAYPIVVWKYSYSQQESDAGPYPVPLTAMAEANSDKHRIVVQPPNWLYEFWDADPSGQGWAVGQASRWDLRTNAMRPPGITSADAAGMPIAPGIIRVAEIQAGVITHAARITVDYCSAEYEWPANHVADMTMGVRSDLMKMGTWLRLKSSVNINGLAPAAKIIATALKKYGAIVIDIGPNWKLCGQGPESSWNWSDINTLRTLHGTDFEVVNTASLIENSRSMSTTQS